MAFADLVAAMDRVAQANLGGVAVTYQPTMGSPVLVTGIFDAQYVLAQGTADAGVEALVPAVFFRFEDLPVDPESDDPTLTIDAIAYRVVERKPDGIGGIVFVLRKVQ